VKAGSDTKLNAGSPESLDWPHIRALVFLIHFVFTRTPSVRTFGSLTHSQTTPYQPLLTWRFFGDEFPEKQDVFVIWVYHIHPIKPGVRMTHLLDKSQQKLEKRKDRGKIKVGVNTCIMQLFLELSWNLFIPIFEWLLNNNDVLSQVCKRSCEFKRTKKLED
jgi:hypothetical protein